MRWALLAAFLAGVAATTWPALRTGPSLRVELSVGYALPEAGDWANTPRNRLWMTSATVVVRARRGCSRADVALERRRVRSGRVVGVVPTFRAARPGEPVGTTVDAYAGDVVEVVARAACRAGADVGLAGEATSRAPIPEGVCRARGLRVLEVTGDSRAGGRRLRRGDPVPASIRLDVRTGRLVVGSPECNGYHVLVLPGRTWAGSYGAEARARPFVGERVVVMRADRRAGGFASSRFPLRVAPGEDACADCVAPLPSSFAVRTSDRRAVVRVYAISVTVTTPGRTPVRVRAGEELFVGCDPRPCRFNGPFLFQPRTPIALAHRPPRRLTQFVAWRGRPPDELLAPARAEVSVIPIRASGGEPAQLVVTWGRDTRRRQSAFRSDELEEKGLIVWRRVRGGWRIAYARRYAWWLNVGVRLGDVTRDGHADVLLTEWNGGTGYCGARRAVASLRSVMRDVYRRHVCETDFAPEAGDLRVEVPIGPCPVQPGSAHCYGGHRIERWRWNGQRLVRAQVMIRCHQPQLDPASKCSAPRR